MRPTQGDEKRLLPNNHFHGSGALPFVIPSVPGFPTSPLSPATTHVVLPKENHMQLTEAATLDRKSGEADLSRLPRLAVGRAVEGSAVPRTFPGNVFRQSVAKWRDLLFALHGSHTPSLAPGTGF
jgi:hypothetical protein